MFTSLRNILGTAPPRHAEQNDTRQDIQRHDPEYERRKKEKQQHDDDLLQGEDSATIAVTALETFLNSFLKELTEKKPQNSFNASSHAQEKEDALNKPNPETNNQNRISGNAAYAANTYQHIAQSQQKTSLLGEINENNADMISLDASEVRTIHALLEDIKLLKEKNIEYIRIERASSFLQSLVNAIQQVKAGFSREA